jgi:hypothetical protein
LLKKPGGSLRHTTSYEVSLLRTSPCGYILML